MVLEGYFCILFFSFFLFPNTVESFIMITKHRIMLIYNGYLEMRIG